MSLLGRHYDEPPMPGAPLQQCSITVQCDDSHTNFYEFSNATWDGCKLERCVQLSIPMASNSPPYVYRTSWTTFFWVRNSLSLSFKKNYFFGLHATNNSTHHVSDPQIGDFDIYFSTPSDANSAFAFPFPGHPVLISERYKLSRSEGMDLRTCVNLQETHSYFEGKDCKGNDIQAIICAGSFGDRKAGVKSNRELAKRGWAYHVAFPRIDRDPKEC